MDQLGTKSGKIKTFISDAGFFAYDNYLFSPHQRIITIIRPRKEFEEKVVNKVRNMSQSLLWYDSRHIHMLDHLIKDFTYRINQTIKLVRDYHNMAKLRLKIFYQYLESNAVNVNRATELLRMKNGLR